MAASQRPRTAHGADQVPFYGSSPASLITAGVTWRFQAFLRDRGFATGINTSDELEFVLQP